MGVKPILEAADDPESKVSHLHFVLNKDDDEKLLEPLLDELKTFCATTRAGRPGNWDIRIFGSENQIYWDGLEIEKKLVENRLADDRKRILNVKTAKNQTFTTYKQEYYAEITMPSAETFFSSKIVGDKKADKAIGVSCCSLKDLSIGNVLRYLNLPESEYCKLFILEQKPTKEGELAEAVKPVLMNPAGSPGWIAVFKHPVI